MRLCFCLLIALSLGACVKPAELAMPAQHDLGLPSPLARLPLKVPLRRVDVQAASWLNTPAMQYRLAYQQSTRRLNYADNRWASPPAQLLEARLGRHLGLATGAVRCKLTVRLDEFIQVFDTPASSRAYLAGEFVLSGDRAEEIVGRDAFELSIPSASPDPAGGVAAFALASDRLAAQAQRWLDSLDARACRGEALSR